MYPATVDVGYITITVPLSCLIEEEYEAAKTVWDTFLTATDETANIPPTFGDKYFRYWHDGVCEGVKNYFLYYTAECLKIFFKNGLSMVYSQFRA